MTLKEALEDIRQRHDVLTPALVVQEAREAKTSAGELLHARLEWRDDVAAETHRLNQARALIRSVRVVYAEATETDDERSVRAFHALPSPQSPSGYDYMPVEAIAEDPMLRAMALRDAEREWKALHRKYSHLSEFTALVSSTLAEAA